jgi:hypothetical protein
MVDDHNPVEEIEQKVNYLWENSEEVGSAVNAWASVVSPQELKGKIMKEWALLQCQQHTQDLEQLIVARVEKLGVMTKVSKRCKEHEDIMGRKF